MPEPDPIHRTDTAAATFRVSRPLRFSSFARDELTRRGVEGYPHEACGLMIGREAADATRVDRITLARNLRTDRLEDRYTLDPDSFVAADAEARRDGLDVVGIWHTHPNHPARPSRTDLEAAWEGYSYVILSVGREGIAAIRSWRLEGEQFVEQSIEETAP